MCEEERVESGYLRPTPFVLMRLCRTEKVADRITSGPDHMTFDREPSGRAGQGVKELSRDELEAPDSSTPSENDKNLGN